jgi:quinolinate synthase
MEENRIVASEIARLKRERNALILAHYYQPPEIQDIADVVGDSLELARKAAKNSAKVVVLCGVHFMAESAAILSPDKVVLLPDMGAGCPMADMVNAQALQEAKRSLPEAVVVSYVNTSAEVKAHSDICCTSANAVKIVNSIPAEKPILFVPDKNLGHFVMRQTGRTMQLWNGWCNTHEWVIPEDVLAAKRKYPDALVLAHPECQPEVTDLADCVGSTAGMLRFAGESEHKEFIVVTEGGILHQLHKLCPEKEFHLATEKLVCPNMKKTTLTKVKDALLTMNPYVRVSEEIRDKAWLSLARMLEVG